MLRWIVILGIFGVFILGSGFIVSSTARYALPRNSVADTADAKENTDRAGSIFTSTLALAEIDRSKADIEVKSSVNSINAPNNKVSTDFLEVKPVKGLNAASSKLALSNPFSPDHEGLRALIEDLDKAKANVKGLALSQVLGVDVFNLPASGLDRQALLNNPQNRLGTNESAGKLDSNLPRYVGLISSPNGASQAIIGYKGDNLLVGLGDRVIFFTGNSQGSNPKYEYEVIAIDRESVCLRSGKGDLILYK